MNVTNFKLSIKVINVQCAQNDKAKTSQLINYLSLHIKNISISSVSGCIRARCSLTVFPQGEKTRSLAVLVAGIANSCLAIVAIILGSFFSPQFSRTAVQSVPSSNSIGIRRLKYILLYCTVLVWRKCSPLKYNFSAYLSRAEFCDLIKSWSSRWNYRLTAGGLNVTII